MEQGLAANAHIEANTTAPVLQNEKAFIAKSIGKDTKEKAQIFFPDLELWANFKD